MNIATAHLPGRDSNLGLHSWMREVASIAQVSLRPPPYPAQDLPRGDGRTVLLIPGFLVGDWIMSRLGDFLASLGYRVEMSGIFFNAGPTARTIAKLEARLLSLSRIAGPVDMVGQSLGGVFAREIARQHPDAVRRVVTLCSPIRFPVTTPLAPFAHVFAPLHDKVWAARMTTGKEPLPVPVTAIYSTDDGIVDWRQCLQEDVPGCTNVRVNGAHATVGSNPQAQIAVALALSA